MVRRKKLLWIGLIFLIVTIAVGAYAYFNYVRPSGRWALFEELHTDPTVFEKYALLPGQRCGNAAFAFPTRGVPLGLWDQAYRFFHRHAGIDIFSVADPGVTPVYAAYPGYLSRLLDWKASVIIRIPIDP